MLKSTKIKLIHLGLSALALIGCGGSDFSGRYQGALNNNFECDRGAERNEKYDAVWTITDLGDGVWQVTEADTTWCPEFRLRDAQEADTALVQATKCPTVQTESYVWDLNVEGGTIKINNIGIDVDIRYKYTVYNSDAERAAGVVRDRCDDNYAGTLAKLAE